MYVLRDKQTPSDNSEGYYTGKTYIFQGSKYAVCENDIKKAKVYKNEKVANKASQKMYENCGPFEVIQV